MIEIDFAELELRLGFKIYPHQRRMIEIILSSPTGTLFQLPRTPGRATIERALEELPPITADFSGIARAADLARQHAVDRHFVVAGGLWEQGYPYRHGDVIGFDGATYIVSAKKEAFEFKAARHDNTADYKKDPLLRLQVPAAQPYNKRRPKGETSAERRRAHKAKMRNKRKGRK